MIKAYQIIITKYAGDRCFMQWFAEMDTKQVAEMRALLKRGVEGRAYASFVIRPHRAGSYSKVFRDIAALVKDKSY